ncbi:VOC family protein [Amaricoccus solimangrovi]|uniref:Glyoxalase/bleomycin resistance/extradiol dioxygenase family protein n=1 Tax=Amaricoccus solimangrovi TaxID=2589815 RepID=A0A501WZ63_9RHOB|nr:VOC family protein [Amaricoccus solimangrovi]TPE53615.1 glyoxalase/bleomycin resistance/extradiol dioxygenase family protein [Amaricoccus solimangrovi]
MAGTGPSAGGAPAGGAYGADAPAILETALYAEDLGAAEAFYGGLIGLPVVARVAGRHVFFRVGAGMLLVFDPRATATPARSGPPVPVHGARGSGHVCFAADAAGLDRLARALPAAGIPLEADFDWPNGARSIYVRDPAGNSVEFAEPRLWQ